MADTMLALFNEISFCELFPPWNMREKTGRPSVGLPNRKTLSSIVEKKKGWAARRDALGRWAKEKPRQSGG